MKTFANTATPADIAEWRRGGKKPGRSRHAVDGFESALERDYAELLELRRRAGEITHWGYEPERLRIGLRCFYTPDFRVLLVGGQVEYHEVKGFMREAARVRLHAAVDRYPEARFFLVKRARGGAWQITNLRDPPPKSPRSGRDGRP